MTWTCHQRQIAAIAWKQTGQPDEVRKVLLRQFPRSLFDQSGKPTGEPSSKSRLLNQGDFEEFMATVENMLGGQIGEFSRGYWRGKAADEGSRLRWLAVRLANTLELHKLLEPNGVGLAGWISNRVTRGRTNRLADLSAKELGVLIESLKAHGRRHGVEWIDEPLRDGPPPPEASPPPPEAPDIPAT